MSPDTARDAGTFRKLVCSSLFLPNRRISGAPLLDPPRVKPNRLCALWATRQVAAVNVRAFVVEDHCVCAKPMVVVVRPAVCRQLRIGWRRIGNFPQLGIGTFAALATNASQTGKLTPVGLCATPF